MRFSNGFEGYTPEKRRGGSKSGKPLYSIEQKN